MHSTLPAETLVENRTCKHCGTIFPITDKDLEFLDRLAPSVAWAKISFPIPSMCPSCRKIQLLAWRNERKIYKRKCDATGKDIISHFPPDSPFQVYEEKIWNSDCWNAKDYGRDFDFSKGFFEQFESLLKVVPRAATAKSPPIVNSDYCNNCWAIGDGYLCFNAQNLENCYYCTDAWYSSECSDCYCIYNSSACFECILAFDSHNVDHSYDVKNSRDSSFLLSCQGCQNCYGCFGLENRQYFIYNTAYSKEDYEAELQKILHLPLSEQKEKFKRFHTGKYAHGTLPNIGSEAVSECSNVVRSKNVFGSRNLQDVEDVRYASILHGTKLSMDYYVWGHNAEKVYFSHQVGNNVQSVFFSVSCWDNIHDAFYSYLCLNGVHDCFGCAWLRNGESYCILNKQYTKEEYEVLVVRIIDHMRTTGEWGEFFPARLSPHGYNETIAEILQPLTEGEALEKGFNWSSYETPFPRVAKIIPASKLPEDISEIPDDILNWAIECEVTGRPFRVIKQELDFYRKHHFPIPRTHPDQRHAERLKWHVNY